MQLAERLTRRGHALAPPTIVARTGWTADELLAAATAREGRPFDFVSLQIGVNDQYRGADLEDYRSSFRTVLAHAIQRAHEDSRRVVVLSIPDWGVTPHADGRDRKAVATEIDRFNAVNRKETSRVGAQYVDVTTASREAAADPALLAPDGLHVSGLMYARWAALALPAVLRALHARA
jgi:lysophospholipase L1-like esterase